MASIVFVLGPGRCGSSTVARILHDRLGVSMGQWFSDSDHANTLGYYEDMAFKTFNQHVLSNTISIEAWMTTIFYLVEQRRSNGAWGIKDPRMCYLLGHYLNFCPDATLIRCVRPIECVAASMQRCYGWDDAMAIATERERLLDVIESDHDMAHLDFSSHRSDDDLAFELKNIIQQKEPIHG